MLCVCYFWNQREFRFSKQQQLSVVSVAWNFFSWEDLPQMVIQICCKEHMWQQAGEGWMQGPVCTINCQFAGGGEGGQDPLRGRGLLVFLSLRRCHMILSMSLGAASHTPQSPLFDPQWKQSVESGRGRGWYFRIFGGHRNNGTGDFYVFQWGELLMGLFWVLSEKRRR